MRSQNLISRNIKKFYCLCLNQGTADPFITSFEELYQLKQMDSLTEKSMAFSPVLVGDSDEVKIAITESDLEDYPGCF